MNNNKGKRLEGKMREVRRITKDSATCELTTISCGELRGRKKTETKETSRRAANRNSDPLSQVVQPPVSGGIDRELGQN